MSKVCLAHALRLRYGVTNPELARAVGVSKQLICKIQLEPERQTPGHEALLERAFETVIPDRQEQARRLAEDFAASRGRLYDIVEEDHFGK